MMIEQKSLTVTQGMARVVRLRDEYYDFLADPLSAVQWLKDRKFPCGDLFTFIQRIPDPIPKFSFHLEWDSAAVVPITTYENWWKRQVNDKTRNMVRKAHKCGVVIREVMLDACLVRGIQAIYNESPYRQGRPFRHFGKDLDTIQAEHATFPDRSRFFGAYYNEELIGFMKLVRGDEISSLMNIISMICHRDKAPTNALIAKAVEVCTEDGVPALQYGTGNDRLIGDFKKHHAFRELLVPRYYVPLTARGYVMLKTGFHRPLCQILPEGVRDRLIEMRSRWVARKSHAENRREEFLTNGRRA